MNTIKRILITLLLIIVSIYTRAADIIHIGNNVFTFRGPIISGDYDRLFRLTNHIPKQNVVLLLNSQGGAAYEGINIGEYIRNRQFSTIVLPNDECYSACAIIWAAGNIKVASFPRSIIGFHAIYNGFTGQETGYANAKLGAVLSRWGYSDRAIEFMTIAGPKEFSYLNYQNARVYNIQYMNYEEFIKRFVDNLEDLSIDTSYTMSAYDVVANFYHALSIADGDLAAAYVIPEKRGIGPFNQISIYNFYSKLRKPLKVHNIEKLNDFQFKVKYTFTATKTQCNGIATVTTVQRNGYYLIKSIKANC